MRTISAASLAEVTKQYGAEPINIIEIEWVEGTRISYADRDSGSIKGRITELSGLDFVINVTEGSDSAEIALALSDVDGDLKTIVDTIDIHKKNVWVYQWFEGLQLDEKFLIFRGEINSPITWNEGDRTLKFTVITKIEDAEIGFSIEEGQFEAPRPELIGKAWPLKFGNTINVPALRFTTPRSGTLATGIGISDFTLPFRIDSAQNLVCPTVFRGFRGEYVGNSFFIRPVFTADEGCALNKCTTVITLENQLVEQKKYEFDKITVIDGETFPQGVELVLNIGGGKFTGVFEGTLEVPTNVFTITSSEHPEFDELGGVPTTDSVNKLLKDRLDFALTINCGGIGGGSVSQSTGGGLGSNSTPSDPSRNRVESSQRSHEFLSAIPVADFFWANPGTEVTLDEGDETVYASNLVPEEVQRVAAFRNFDGVRRLVTVPASLYTVRTTDFQSYMVSEIVFPDPLSQTDADWEDDDIYITSISTVGPNTVNIMEWLIGKYTDLGTDPTSFNYVRDKLANYPMDFPYLDRLNILDALQQLAFQARCAIYLRDGIFFLKYLPELAASIATIDEDDVDANTLELYHSDTEDIVTKLIAEWKRDYSIEDPNKVILRHNVQIYGTQEDTFNFYAYNELDYVHKSATYWLIRKSNTWRLSRFQTPLQHLALETFDTVDLDLPDIAPGIVPGLIEKADYNSNDQALDFEVWSPIRSGTTVVYDFAHPANIDQELQWPTEDDRDQGFIGSGDAPGFDTRPPDGHILSSVTNLPTGFSLGPCASQGSTVQSFSDQTCGNGNGDTYPSDTEDSVVDKEVQGGLPPDSPVDPGEINVGDGPVGSFAGETEIESLERRLDSTEQAARQAQQTANNANEEAGGDGASTNPDLNNEDDEKDGNNLPTEDELDQSQPPAEAACRYYTNVKIIRATILFKTGEIAGGQPIGFLGVSQDVRTDQWIFASCAEAGRMATAVRAYYLSRQEAEDITQDEELPISASIICPLHSTCEDDACRPTLEPLAFDSPDPTADTNYMNDIGPFIPDNAECPPE